MHTYTQHVLDVALQYSFVVLIVIFSCFLLYRVEKAAVVEELAMPAQPQATVAPTAAATASAIDSPLKRFIFFHSH